MSGTFYNVVQTRAVPGARPAGVYVQRAGRWARRCYRALGSAILISGVLLLSATGGSDRRSTMPGWPLVVVLLAALCSGTALGLSRVAPGCPDVTEHGAVVNRAIGEVWTTSDCNQAVCHAIPNSARGAISLTPCKKPPSLNCLLKSQNMSAEYPECCPEYQCFDKCFSSSLQRWFDVGDTWTETGCQRASCTPSGLISLLPCGLIRVPGGCKAVPGDPDAEYPECCHKPVCEPEPEEPQCYDKDLGQHFAVGETWTQPGCFKAECNSMPNSAEGLILSRSCPQVPSSPNCLVKKPQSASAEYPECCPEYQCFDKCFSSSLQRWFDVGDTWTETGCQRASCTPSGLISLLPCGLIRVPGGCKAVPGDPDAEYPECCHKPVCEPEPEQPQCYDKELDRHFAVGEKWTLPDCSGQATCGEGGFAAAVGCPLEATDTPGCGLDNGDLRFDYPQCCPKITCEACHSERLDRYFGPSDTWTGSSCTQNVCHGGPYGAEVRRQSCNPLGRPPFPDCEVIGEDLERGDFPHCCPIYRCPGRCLDKGHWYEVGQQWDDDGCLRAICVGTDRVSRMSCPLIRYDPSRLDCHVVEGDTSAAFPACCSSVQCDTPVNECQDQEGASREIGATWTEPGCIRSECKAAEGGAAVVLRSNCPPPPSADCYPVEGTQDQAEYPDCCPTYRCPDRCFSPIKDRWFSVGDEWTEDACIHATCVGTGQVRQAPCPFVSARRLGCSVVPGDLATEYPGCCPHVECDPNPYG